MTFKEYVLQWWDEFLEKNEDEAGVMMSEILDIPVGEIGEYLDEEETPGEWCSFYDDADKIYRTFFGYGKTETDFGLDTEEFLANMFAQAAPGERSYEDKFVGDMACHGEGYISPEGFFNDLAYGGCQSGMVGILIYNSDCKNIYVENIDDMEDFKAELEDELGEPLHNNKGLPHYTWMCWFCYEELAHTIAQELWPDKF